MEILKFFDWSYKKGAEQAHELDYATLPTEVVEQIRSAWKTQIKDSKGDVLFKEDFK